MQELLKFYSRNESIFLLKEIRLILKLIQLGMFKPSDLKDVFICGLKLVNPKALEFEYEALNMLTNVLYDKDGPYYIEITRRDVYLYRRTKLNFDVFEKTIIHKAVISKIYDPIVDNELICLLFKGYRS